MQNPSTLQLRRVQGWFYLYELAWDSKAELSCSV
jgi:hypothetical protein